MDNLNDLIWTDEDGNDDNSTQPQNERMYQKCMIAFCDVQTAGNFYGCIKDRVLGTISCLPNP